MSSAAALSLDRIAEGLWGRLRDLRRAQERWDRFVSEPGEPPPDAGAATAGEAERVATELVLRALRAGAEALNHRILVRLRENEERAASLAALTELTGLPRIALTERVQDLAQVGLVTYMPETRLVRATGLTEGFLGLLDDVRDRLLAKAGPPDAEPRA